MNGRRASFDRLARIYRALEMLAFGRDLERARFRFLDRLGDRRKILVLGEGDGRCLARLVALAPAARIHCVDFSPAMLARAAERIADDAGRERVSFECADVSSPTWQPPANDYDAVITFFLLDCFEPATAARMIASIGRAVRPSAHWLFADFVLPERGLARLRARVWLAALYAFFRWQTGLKVRALPPSEALIAQAGFRREAAEDFQGGLIRSAVFRAAAGDRSTAAAGTPPPGVTAA